MARAKPPLIQVKFETNGDGKCLPNVMTAWAGAAGLLLECDEDGVDATSRLTNRAGMPISCARRR